MSTPPPGDPEGPKEFICLGCATVRRDPDTFEPVRNAAGLLTYRCDLCTARHLDRVCECFLCPWLKE
jgi:hypothetical protein